MNQQEMKMRTKQYAKRINETVQVSQRVLKGEELVINSSGRERQWEPITGRPVVPDQKQISFQSWDLY